MKMAKQSPEFSDTILVVNDSPNLTLMRKRLEDNLPSVELLTCKHVETAQALLQETEVALTLIDVNMPTNDGLELCKLIKNEATTSFVSVILFSSQASDPKIKAKALALGADDFITRPIDTAELCARVKAALRIHRAESASRHTASRTEAEAAQLGRVLEESLHEIFIFDAQTLRFVQVNRGGRENIGYSAVELRGMTPLDIKPEMTETSFTKLLEPLRKGVKEKIQFQTFHRRKKGSDYPVEVHLQLMTGNHPVFVAMINDITERKLAEEKLRESEARTSIATNASGIGVWDRDIVKDTLVWDKRMFEIYGVKPESFGGAHEVWKQGVHPQDLERCVTEVEAAERGIKPFDTEFRIVRPDGDIRYVRASSQVLYADDGTPLRMVGTNLDITKRKQSEEANKKNSSLLQKAEEMSNQGAWEWDVLSDQWTFSENWLRIHGCSFSGISREKLMELAHPDDASKIERSFHDALKGRAEYRMEHRIIRQNDKSELFVP